MASLTHVLCCRGLTRGGSYECDLIWSLINRVAGAASPDELSVTREKLELPSDSNDHTDASASPESKEARQVYMGRVAEAATPFVSEREQQRALWWGFNGLIRGVCPISSCPQRVRFRWSLSLGRHTWGGEKDCWAETRKQRWTSLMRFRPSVCELALYSHIRKPRKRKCLKQHSLVNFPRVYSQHRTLGTVSVWNGEEHSHELIIMSWAVLIFSPVTASWVD